MKRLLNGMLVEVIAGVHKGKRGKIVYISVNKSGNNVVGIEGIGEHTKKYKSKLTGKQEEKKVIKAIHESNVMPISEKTDKPTRIAVKIVDSKKTRVSVKGDPIKDVNTYKPKNK